MLDELLHARPSVQGRRSIEILLGAYIGPIGPFPALLRVPAVPYLNASRLGAIWYIYSTQADFTELEKAACVGSYDTDVDDVV